MFYRDFAFGVVHSIWNKDRISQCLIEKIWLVFVQGNKGGKTVQREICGV